MHVHVYHAEGEVKFWLEPRVELAVNYGLSQRRLTGALRSSWSMRMKFTTRGKPTSVVEVTNVSKHGFWLLLDERERFLAFEHFPWFRDVSIGQLCNVELPHPHHLYWPDLDVDVAVESISHPERFPLVSRARSNANPRTQPARKRRARS